MEIDLKILSGTVPDGVMLRSLKAHGDTRGTFMEMYREEWAVGCASVQWNIVHSSANVLRGVHVHVTHADYLIVVTGVMLLGLHDIRDADPAKRRSALIELNAADPVGVTIPPGVCHGFCSALPTTNVYSVSAYWNPADELGCRYDAPELGLTWPLHTPLLSDRDTVAVDYDRMCHDYKETCLRFAQ